MFLTQISKLTRISSFSHTSHHFFHTSKPFSSSQRNLYEILGVSRTATATEIKASYYKLAQQYHPDKNSSANSKDKFSEINNAYETLSDASKRREYDSSGTSAYSYSYSSSSTSYTGRTPEEDIFADMFSGRAKRNFDDAIFEDFYKIFGMGHSERHETSVRGQNVTLEMDLSFEESIHGVKREVSYERKEICNSCEGKGTKSSSQPQQCKVCKGRGTMRISGSFVPFEVVCSNCEGYGSVYKNRCNTCSGKGVNNRKITESIMIPRGVNNGELVKLKGKGSTGQNGGVRGDLVVKVAVKPSLYYRRRGLDVFTDVYIHASQAILGGNVMVDTLYGPKIVEILKGTQIGDSIKIPKMGISKGHPQSFKGDHYAEVKVYIPKEISEEDILLYEKLSMIEQRRDEAEKAKEAAQAQAKEKQEQQQQKKQAHAQTQKKKKRQESSEEEDLYGDFDFVRGFEKEEKRRANRENFRKNKNPYW